MRRGPCRRFRYGGGFCWGVRAGCRFSARVRDRAGIGWAGQRPGSRGGLAGRPRPGGGARLRPGARVGRQRRARVGLRKAGIDRFCIR